MAQHLDMSLRGEDPHCAGNSTTSVSRMARIEAGPSSAPTAYDIAPDTLNEDIFGLSDTNAGWNAPITISPTQPLHPGLSTTQAQAQNEFDQVFGTGFIPNSTRPSTSSTTDISPSSGEDSLHNTPPIFATYLATL
jgi:hypothetical protein